MKNIQFSLVATLIIAGTFAHAATAKEFLSAQEKKDALGAIDGTCGDTWCEGDYGYRFKDMSCDSILKSCQVKFEMIDGAKSELASIGETAEYIASEGTKHSVACTIKNLSKASDILAPRRELTEGFYTSLTNCISALETKLNR